MRCCAICGRMAAAAAGCNSGKADEAKGEDDDAPLLWNVARCVLLVGVEALLLLLLLLLLRKALLPAAAGGEAAVVVVFRAGGRNGNKTLME